MEHNSCKKKITTFILFIFYCMFAGTPWQQVHAQEDVARTRPAIGIFHASEYAGRDLPSPGAPLELRVQLFNTNDVSIQVRTFATIDGRLIELIPSKAYLNKDDYPEYVIETHAPHVAISYFFVAYSPDGHVIRSEDYTLQRPCVPSLTPVSAELSDDIHSGQERLIEMVHKNWAIEEELRAYEHAKTLLEAIQKEMERLNGSK